MLFALIELFFITLTHRFRLFYFLFFFIGKTSSGYEGQLFARPALYDLMLSRVPEDKISLGKKILKVEEKDNKVTIHCADNSTHTGDILVGADGAYSTIRQNIYKDMADKGILPKSDAEDLVAGYTTLVGVTDSLDLSKYPMLKDGNCDSEFMGGNGRSVRNES